MIFLDTNILIDIRDSAIRAAALMARLDRAPAMSVVSWVELEGGVYRQPASVAHRRRSLDRLLDDVPVVYLRDDDVATYGRIVAAAGFDRRRILDRLIAAQCLVRGAALLTGNAGDFTDIEGLRLIAW